MPKVDSILKKIMKDLDIQAPLEELKIGIEVEKEHTRIGPKEGKYAVAPVKLIPLIKIAAAHLAELPDYYTRLKKMEEEGKKKNASLKLMDTAEVNNILNSYEHNEQIALKENSFEGEVSSEDDFFSACNASEMWGEDEEAIYPDDIVRKPKQPNMVTSAKSLLPPGVLQLSKLQEQLNETLHYLVNKLLPEAKENPKQFNSLLELRDNLEVSLISIYETLEKMK